MAVCYHMCSWIRVLLRILLFLNMALVCVLGDYIIEVGVHNYDNPTNRGVTRGSNNCCDGRNRATCGGSRRCDNRFTFCLKPAGNSDDGTGSCSSPVRTSTQTNTDDAAIDFTQDTVLGLENPLVLQGISTAWQGAQLYVEVNDIDGSNMQLVDIWRLNGSPEALPVGSTSPQTSYTGINGYGTFTFSFEVICAENYYGTFCENLDECLSESIDCNQQGECVDGDGFATCTCDPGFTGEFCETIDYCFDIECSGNGQCNNLQLTYSCSCNPGFTGAMCETIYYCNGVNCSENGICMNGLNRHTCICDAGYTGADCETDNNECVGVDCGVNGLCMDLIGLYRCDCGLGFTGEFCEININECLGIDCTGLNGACVDGIATYVCDCSPGYTGQLCEFDINECEIMNISCSGRGQCVDELNSYSCDCDSGFSGDLCEVNIDDCQGNNCSEDSQCVDLIDRFECDCNLGYTGDICEVNIDDCVGVNCSGNGQCVDGVNLYSCDCDTGYTGTLCDQKDDCVGVNCSGNGQCVDGVNNFTCVCQSGFTGDLCSVEIQELRADNNGGPIAGGVVGGLLGLVVLTVVVIMIAVLLKRNSSLKKYDVDPVPVATTFTNLPGDNPVYGVCEMNQDIIPITVPNQTTNKNNSQSFPEHEFDNPIYSSSDVDPPLYESLENQNGAELAHSDTYAYPDGEENNYEYISDGASVRSPVRSEDDHDSQIYDDIRPL